MVCHTSKHLRHCKTYVTYVDLLTTLSIYSIEAKLETGKSWYLKKLVEKKQRSTCVCIMLLPKLEPGKPKLHFCCQLDSAHLDHYHCSPAPPPRKGWWGQLGTGPSLPYPSQGNLLHARMSMHGYVWGKVAVAQICTAAICSWENTLPLLGGCTPRQGGENQSALTWTHALIFCYSLFII